jgi:hypothetical protein
MDVSHRLEPDELVACHTFGGRSRGWRNGPKLRGRIVSLIVAMPALFLVVLTAPPPIADAQPAGRTYRIGYLRGGTVRRRALTSTDVGRAPRTRICRGKESRDRAALRRVQV